jgi:hypothetical protein
MLVRVGSIGLTTVCVLAAISEDRVQIVVRDPATGATGSVIMPMPR